MKWFAAVLVAALLAGCGAGKRRTLTAADVSPDLAGSETPFAQLRLAWVETGSERYDRFFREAAALQGALVLAERAIAGEGHADGGGAIPRERLVELLAEVGPRAREALARGEELLESARADFAHDEAKAMAIEPALHEALGQVRDAASRAPALRDGLLAR